MLHVVVKKNTKNKKINLLYTAMAKLEWTPSYFTIYYQ